jgi:hypothetical protein
VQARVFKHCGRFHVLLIIDAEPLLTLSQYVPAFAPYAAAEASTGME